MIYLKNICKTFIDDNKKEVHAVNDVSLTINDGDIFGIIGFSGAGKSTLVRCINLLERPTSGTVEVDGKDLTKLSEKELRESRKKIGMIFQHFNLFPSRTIFGNVAFPLQGSGLSKEEIAAKVRNLLELVGISEKENAYPSQLSGGQKQRVAIAGILAMKPKCIILDESTAMLDPGGRKAVIDTITRINKEENITVILITHYMEEVTGADYVYVMDSGKVVMEGMPRDIFARSDELEEFRLAVPEAVRVAMLLREKGIELPKDILDAGELVDAVMKLQA